ncbi:MAG: hypothetical protein ACK5QX_03545, partial [bacterium]
MTDVAKLGNAEFQKQIEAAAKGLAEASDGLMGVLKEANGNQAALLADATKLSVQYGITEEMIGIQQAFKATDGKGVNIERVITAFKALAEKVLQEGHPIKARVEAMRPEIQAAVKAKDHTAIGKTIKILVGENGLPEGPIRNLFAQLQKPIEQSAEHGVQLVKLIENEGKLSPAKQLILKRVAATHLPKLKEHLASLEGLGMVLPKEAREQLAAIEQKLGHSAAGKKAAEAAAKAAKASEASGHAAHTTSASTTGHTSSGSGHSPAPSTTVSNATSEGRKWYQWLTHEEEGSKAIFSGKRTAIAGGIAAAAAGGVYLLLNRNKDEGNWQSRTNRPAESAQE